MRITIPLRDALDKAKDLQKPTREEVAAKAKAYRETHREEAAAKAKAYRETHREEVAAKQRAAPHGALVPKNK